MATQPAPLTLKAGEVPPFRLGAARLADFWALTKPEVNLLILITTFAGFYLGCSNEARPFSFLASFNTLFGTLLVASGTGTLNQYIERKFDAQMRRTARRPAAAGRLKPRSVLAFGIALAAIGSIYLAITASVLASLLALLTLLSYLFIYTPLKRRTPLCVLVGAFPGAMPPLIGWAAASAQLNIKALMLYAILFLWQFPHFMAIAWMYREDYSRAGYLVLPPGKLRANFMAVQSVLPCLLLVPAGLILMLLGHIRFAYLFFTLLLSSAFLVCALRLAADRSNIAARRLLSGSIIYLPLIFFLALLGKS